MPYPTRHGDNMTNSDMHAATMHLQMACALPPGELTDRAIVEAAGSTWRAPVLPAPNNLSARGVQELLNLDPYDNPLAPAALTGLRNPEAVRTLAASADVDWIRWAVRLNPASDQLTDRELPPLPQLDELERDRLSMVSSRVWLSALPHLPWINSQTRTRLLRHVYMGALATDDASAVRAVWDRAYLPVQTSMLSSLVVKHWGLQDLGRTMRHQPEKWDQIINHFKQHAPETPAQASCYLEALTAKNDPDSGPDVMRAYMKNSRQLREGDTPVRLGGPGYVNAWLPGALKECTSAVWRHLLHNGMKPVGGRHAGDWLYQVTGDDPGLWQTALDLLRDWEEPLPEWLVAVAALK